jgi:hypothetical protein
VPEEVVICVSAFFTQRLLNSLHGRLYLKRGKRGKKGKRQGLLRPKAHLIVLAEWSSWRLFGHSFELQ